MILHREEYDHVGISHRRPYSYVRKKRLDTLKILRIIFLYALALLVQRQENRRAATATHRLKDRSGENVDSVGQHSAIFARHCERTEKNRTSSCRFRAGEAES